MNVNFNDLGLESIGKELVGKEKWEQIYPLQQVLHQETVSDFDPTEVSEELETNVSSVQCLNLRIA
jgi:hypothetical protein